MCILDVLDDGTGSERDGQSWVDTQPIDKGMKICDAVPSSYESPYQQPRETYN